MVGCHRRRFQRKASPAAVRTAMRIPPMRQASATKAAMVSHGGTATSASVETSIQPVTTLLTARVRSEPWPVSQVRA